MMAIASLLVSCNSHPKFETSVDAVEGCKKELAALKGEKEMSIDQLTKATSSWLETQDSAYSVFSRDTSIYLRSPVALAFFVVSDSIRGELKRLAFSQPRSLNDVMYLKLNTATSSEKIEKWRKEEVLRLLRQQRLVQNIADEMNRAGIEIAPEIKNRMADVYKVNSDATFRHINSRVNANFAMIPREQVKIILDDTQPVFSKIAYQHLGKNRVIRSALQSQMAQAAILGESQEKIIKRIQKVTGQAEYQARRVAQTERNRVQSQARADALHEAAQAGVIVTKKWSARMRNTRDSHAALNGVEIPENEKFRTIWGNELRYPGDPEAPAAEVINCRCILIPDVKMPG